MLESSTRDSVKAFNTDNLIRWSGLALIIGGLCYLPIPVRQWVEARVAEPYQASLTVELALWESRLVFQKFFLLFGFFGIFVYQAHRAGRLGLIAFIVASIGNVALAGATMINAAMDPPLLALGHPLLGCMGREEFFDPSFSCESARLGAQFFWTVGALASATIGTAMLGIAIVRAGVLPRIAGAMIAGFWIAYPLRPLLEPAGLGPILLTIIAVGYSWCGWAMWRDPALRLRAD
jgi:hypothetical protein